MTPTREARHGPIWTAEGVGFRLWAPSAQMVRLQLNDAAPQKMNSVGDGWHELTIADAKDGDRYFFEVDGRLKVPDPASRFQPEGITGPSLLVKPQKADVWAGKSWEEAVIYELHVGTFTPEGTYRGAEDRLGYLASLGVTAIELMPLAAFEGRHGWGYDGVYPFAPHAVYGTPDDLRHFIATAHRHGLMVFLDVVYNHFGPEGDFLNEYAKEFFTDAYKTPWGSAINMGNRAVRDFYIDNALYWLNDYGFDGLRFDAVHAIVDKSDPHILHDLAETIKLYTPGKHLVLENDKNEARYLAYDHEQKPKFFYAQWDDDLHHCFHVLMTGETNSYYADYKNDPLRHLGRCLTQGFAYQGEPSAFHGEPRGEKSDHLPPQAFVSFLQNHDQIGNRAMGERIDSLAPKEKLILATALLALAPHPPMFFMGQEWATKTPFFYFCDFKGELADKIREGRRNEFKSFPAFADPALRAKIPDPNDEKTFRASCLNWREKDETVHAAHISFVMRMLALRRQFVLPLLQSKWEGSAFDIKDGLFNVRWHFGGGDLCVAANFSDNEIERDVPDAVTHIWGVTGRKLPAWHSVWHIETRDG